MPTQQQIKNLGSLELADYQPLPLSGADDQQTPWREMVNTRLRIDGQYAFWKTRGGTTEVNSFFGNILTLYAMQVEVSGTVTEYLAVHTSSGKVYLWDIEGETSTEIVSSGFSTTQQIQFCNIGRFLFMFDYDGGQQKYYDLTEQSTFDYLSYNQSYITAVDFLSGDLPGDNLWGFEKDADIIVFPNADGVPEYESYISSITSLEDGFIEWLSPGGETKVAFWGDPASEDSLTDVNVILPYSADLESLVGEPSNKKDDGAGGTTSNEKYVLPTIYRQYIVVDVLNDGSVALAGRPYQLEATTNDMFQDGAVRVRFTVKSPGANVAKRYLCASRWQASASAAFKPSSPSYANSPLFIIGEVNKDNLFVTDDSTDDDLIRPLSEIMPLPAGVPDLFGTGQVAPNSVASFGGSMAVVGYTVSRPLPRPYTAPASATNENIFVDFSPTTQLANNMAVAFQFEYTDGKRSNIVETEEFFQQGNVSSETPVVCSQEKATATHTVTAGCSSDGTLTVTYQGETVNVALTTASHSAPSDVAEAIRQAINADPDIRLSADVITSADLEYTEKRYGEEFNGNTVDIDPSTTGVTFNTQDPTTSGATEPAGTPARAWVRMAENYASSGSATYKLVVDGVESDPWTVNHDDPWYETVVTAMEAALDASAAIQANWITTTVIQNIGGIDYRVLEIKSNDPGNESHNDLVVDIQIDSGTYEAHWRVSAPGVAEDLEPGVTAGADVGCIQATASIDVSANGLGVGGDEDHLITVDNNSTDLINIVDTDTPEQIVDKYITAIEADSDIDVDWKATKEDQGGGVWRLILTYRQYGSVGNGKGVSVSGDVLVTVSANSPSEGGDDAGSVPEESGSEKSANQIQIHSLNALVSKIYILGRTGTDPNYDFHPIRQVEITDPGAHGMVIELPNSASDLTDIEGETFTEPSADDILESVELKSYMLVGTPYQQLNISAQQRIADSSNLQRAIPLDYDPDKSSMRFQMVLFTDRNIQVGYYLEQVTEYGSIFTADFEISQDEYRPTNREGITRIGRGIFYQTDREVRMWSPSGDSVLINNYRYDVLDEKNIIDVVRNTLFGEEIWLICRDKTIVVYDPVLQATRRIRYDGGSVGTPRAGAFFKGVFYIGMDTDLCDTDQQDVFDDVGQGAGEGTYVTGEIESGHLGAALINTKLLELTVRGQTYSCQTEIDLQDNRRESVAGSWSKTFTADMDLGSKTLNMAGASYQIQRRAPMPKIRLTFSGASDGFIESVQLKTTKTQNIGKARE